MQESIGKLSNTILSTKLTYTFINQYFMTRVYFGSGIMYLTPPQEKQLQDIYERPLLLKLQLGEKFPRSALYSRAKALGVGVMKPRTIISAMAMRLYIANMRANSPTSKIIKTSLNNDIIFLGEKSNNASLHNIKDSKDNSWTQQIAVILKSRKITLKNHPIEKITVNKTIM